MSITARSMEMKADNRLNQHQADAAQHLNPHHLFIAVLRAYLSIPQATIYLNPRTPWQILVFFWARERACNLLLEECCLLDISGEMM